jgi:hypothetical protein
VQYSVISGHLNCFLYVKFRTNILLEIEEKFRKLEEYGGKIKDCFMNINSISDLYLVSY